MQNVLKGSLLLRCGLHPFSDTTISQPGTDKHMVSEWITVSSAKLMGADGQWWPS